MNSFRLAVISFIMVVIMSSFKILALGLVLSLSVFAAAAPMATVSAVQGVAFWPGG